MMRIYQTGLLLFALMLSACMAIAPTAQVDAGAAGQAEDAVFVIRHLQKASGDDPVLTSEGAANAQRLAEMLAGKNITAIYSTRTRRTMQTGEPLARRLGLTIIPYDPYDPEALVEVVRAGEGSVLVVGHSNTVGGLVTRFGGNTAPELTEQDYGSLFMVDADGDVHEFTVE